MILICCIVINTLKNLDIGERFNNITPFMGVEEERLVTDWELNNMVLENNVLDSEFTMNELNYAINNLKCNKAHGIDNILNEFMLNGNDMLKVVMLKLFNFIFNTGFFPKEWAIGQIIPIHKKGDKNNLQNYRGITLLSCLGKLFTSLVNYRLNKWAEDNDIFCEQQ